MESKGNVRKRRPANTKKARGSKKPVSRKKTSGARKVRKSKRLKRYYKIMLIRCALVLVLVLIVFLSFHLFFRSYVKKNDNGVIFNGISIGHVDVSGLKEEEAREKVLNTFENDKEKELILVIDDETKIELTLDDVAPQIKDVDEAVKKAYGYGRTGSYFSKYKEIKKSNKKDFAYEEPFDYFVTEEGSKEILKTDVKEYLDPPVNAGVSYGDEGVYHIPEKKGEVIDIKKTVESINTALKEDITKDVLEVNAHISLENADITDEDVAGITDLIGTFTTYYGADGSGRACNIERGAELLDQKLLKPGEEISVEKEMGAMTEENGFSEAGSYEGDEIVSSIGGGICQVSSTLYNAVLNAELDVTERAAHSLRVSYVDISADAAIAENLLDLKFVNNMETPVFIESVLSGGNITFNIFGKETRDPARTIEFTGEVTSETEPEGKKFVEADEDFGEMYTKTPAQPATSARLLKTIYMNGEKTGEEVINYSSYLEMKEVVGVGVNSDNAEAVDALKAAIESQNEEKINKVIEKYKGEDAE